MNEPEDRPLTRQCVNWTARQIRDPILRLRYLQYAAPRYQTSRWKSRNLAGLLALLVLGSGIVASSLGMLHSAHAASPKSPKLPAPPPIHRAEAAMSPPADVWLVEKTSDFEIYSNGLHIENQYAVNHRPRAYTAFSVADPEGNHGEKRTDPAGIVYHTTESHQAPFESSQNNLLKRVGESLIDYVRRHRCYNFLIDRFGRVFRIVTESDAADHAGHSVWADDRYLYVDLNDSFIGIAFEAETGTGKTEISAGNAQVAAAAMLTEMLRSRYGIPGRDCVTHAQVSVNPSNMQVGYHVDWASSFPFERLGLPDNYAVPLPAVSLFGFAFDASYEQLGGVRLAAAASDGAREVVERADAAHLSPTAYRKVLNRRYSKIMASRHR